MALSQKQFAMGKPFTQRSRGVSAGRCAAPRRAPSTVRAATAPQAAPAKFIPRWDLCFDYLRSKGLKTVSPEEASKLVESGEWVLVDVRKADQHAAAAPKGAVSVPMYKQLSLTGSDGGFDFSKLLKSAMYAFNGVAPIDPNTQFVQEVAAAAGGKGVIFACEAGGTMRPTVNFAQGKASRSLQACYKAMAEGGMDRVHHLDRGIFGWYQADLPFTGDYKPEIGRFPSAASEPTLTQTINQSRGYDVRPGDKKE